VQASAAQHKAEHLHAGNGVAAASAAANGKGSSNGAAGAGNGDHAKPVSPAAVTSRPPPPPGLDLPIEDQRESATLASSAIELKRVCTGLFNISCELRAAAICIACCVHLHNAFRVAHYVAY